MGKKKIKTLKDLFKPETKIKGICDDCIHYKSNNKKCQKCEYNIHRQLLNKLKNY